MDRASDERVAEATGVDIKWVRDFLTRAHPPLAYLPAALDIAKSTITRILDSLNQQVAIADAEKARADAACAFKAYVHKRLDNAGIPTHPEGPHSKEGCRVGDRLDILIAQRDDAISDLVNLATRLIMRNLPD